MQHLGTIELYSDRIYLRKFKSEDAYDAFKNWMSDPEVTKYLSWPTHQKVEESKAIIDTWISEYANANYYNWVIVSENGFQPIGSISVINFNEETKTAEIGYCLGQEWWHEGLTSRALALVIDYLFMDVQIDRIIASHDVRNVYSGAVMKKCGMVYCETIKNGGHNNQGIADEANYEITREAYIANHQPVVYDFKLLEKHLELIKNCDYEDEEAVSQITYGFHSSLKRICSEYDHLGLPNHYRTVLSKYNLDLMQDEIDDIQIETLNIECLLALMVGIYAIDRFYEGTVEEAFRNGIFTRCVKRLKELE